VEDGRITTKCPISFHTQTFLARLIDNVDSIHIMSSLFLFDPVYIRHCVNYAKTLCSSTARNLHKITINISVWMPYRNFISSEVTNPKAQSPLWEVDSRTDGQVFPILMNAKVPSFCSQALQFPVGKGGVGRRILIFSHRDCFWNEGISLGSLFTI
jgi:hypothetical protein